MGERIVSSNEYTFQTNLGKQNASLEKKLDKQLDFKVFRREQSTRPSGWGSSFDVNPIREIQYSNKEGKKVISMENDNCVSKTQFAQYNRTDHIRINDCYTQYDEKTGEVLEFKSESLFLTEPNTKSTKGTSLWNQTKEVFDAQHKTNCSAKVYSHTGKEYKKLADGLYMETTLEDKNKDMDFSDKGEKVQVVKKGQIPVH